MNSEIKAVAAILGGVASIILAVAIPAMLYSGYKIKKLAESPAPLELACSIADNSRFEPPCIILMNKASK